MTLVFGKLVDEFNQSDLVQPNQLKAVVNTYVYERLMHAQSWGLTLVMSTTNLVLLGSFWEVGKLKATFERRINQVSKEAAEFYKEVLSSMNIVAAYMVTSLMGRGYSCFVTKLTHRMVWSAPLSSRDYAATYFVLL